MTTAFHAFPNYDLKALNAGSASRYNVTSAGALKVLLIAPPTAFTWTATAQAVSTVTLFLAGDGTNGPLTEVSAAGTGYSRQALTGVTVSDSGAVTTLTCANPSWSGTFNATYAMFYDFAAGGGSETLGIPVCYWDFGGTQSVTAATFTLTISGSGLVQWTAT